MGPQQSSGQAPHRPPVGPLTLLRLLVIGVVASAIGVLIGFLIPWFPTAAATQAHTIDTLYYVLIIVTVPVFVLVTTVVLFSVFRFRMRPGEERLDGPPIHGSTRLEVIWTAGPATIIAALVVYAAIVLHDISVPKKGEMAVGVTGQQWLWSFDYPSYKSGGKPVVSDVLYLPIDQPVRFEIRSVDVIHTFWIPAFRLQEDAVPGITTSFRATPDRIGVYPVICNQLCGYGHSTMRTTLHIVTRAAFRAWLAARGVTALPSGSGSTQTAAVVAKGGRLASTVRTADRYIHRGHSSPTEGGT
jgi:cytochrome c oxidase subunit 2